MDVTITKTVNDSLNNEHILLKVLNSCNLNFYLLFDTTYDENGVYSNKQRHLFVFPNINVKAGDYVRVYTKEGVRSEFKNKAGTTTYNVYWGLDHKILNKNGDGVYLLHYDDWMKKEVI